MTYSVDLADATYTYTHALRIAVATRHRGLHVYPLPGGQVACAGESANGTFVVTRLLADRASDVTPVALLPHPLRVNGKPVVLAVVVVHNDEGNKKATKGQDTRSGDDGRLTGHARSAHFSPSTPTPSHAERLSTSLSRQRSTVPASPLVPVEPVPITAAMG
jgi:hypothetical protein